MSMINLSKVIEVIDFMKYSFFKMYLEILISKLKQRSIKNRDQYSRDINRYTYTIY